MSTDIVILAGGQGKRMQSEKPKVLHQLGGKTLLEHVLNSAQHFLSQTSGGSIHIVIGYGADKVKASINNRTVKWYLQEQQLGTGHAIQQVLLGLNPDHRTLILYGDVPLIHVDTLTSLNLACNNENLAILTAYIQNPIGYGRIIRNRNNDVISVIEQKDATPEQQQINEINTGIMVVPSNKLQHWATQLKNNNAQAEFYLTDIIAMAVTDNIPIVTSHPLENIEIKGINTPSQLIDLERTYQHSQAQQLLNSGVLIQDPRRFDLRGTLKAGKNTMIDINNVFEGDVTLGKNVVIEPGCIIRNSTIGDNTVIKSYSIVENTTIKSYCEIGPFARLRPNTILNDHVRIGNFVEIKKTNVGKHSKVNHLTYLGDTVVGEKVNIGAGTVTCNYDGQQKQKTHIGNNAFIGSNNSLIAPVSIGAEATTGAGSTITQDIPDKQLAIARARQTNISDWKRPQTDTTY